MEKFHKTWKNVAIRKWVYDELEKRSVEDGRSLSNYLEFQLIHHLHLKEENVDE